MLIFRSYFRIQMPTKLLNTPLLRPLTFFGMVILGISQTGLAQQDPQLSLFHQNTIFLNPAFAGFQDKSLVQLHVRNQWTGYETSTDGTGSLGTTIVGASLPLGKWNTGLGIVYMSDKTPSGVSQQTIRLQMAYHYPLASGTLSVGLRAGLQSKSFDGRVYRVRDVGDPLINTFSGKVVSESIPDVGLGVVYAGSNWNVGLSADHLANAKYTFSDPSVSMPLAPVYAVHGMAELLLTTSFDVIPFAQVRYYSGRVLPEAGARVEFRDMFWVGGSYRLNDAAIGMVGVSVLNNRLDLGYSLDYTMVNVAIKAPLTHEVFVRFVMPTMKMGTKGIPIKTPRFRIN
jgi:type IX secretion system PorP/SprF family membrane protein